MMMITRQEHDTIGRQLHAAHHTIVHHSPRLISADKALRAARSSLEDVMYRQHRETANVFVYYPGGSPPTMTLDEIRATIDAISSRVSDVLCPNHRARQSLAKALELLQ
jgi:hypothetical protein